MKKRGFTSKETSWNWTDEDIKLLQNQLKSISKNESIIHTIDPYYWISHYTFHDRIPKNAIKKLLKIMSE